MYSLFVFNQSVIVDRIVKRQCTAPLLSKCFFFFLLEESQERGGKEQSYLNLFSKSVTASL